MWSFLADVAMWLFVLHLQMFVWVMNKTLRKDRYVIFLMGLAQIFANIGRMLMLRAISFSIENKLELSLGEPTEAQESEEEGIPELEVTEEAPIQENLPTFKGDDGNTVPLCFDPLPEYSVFAALFESKYGRFGKCTVTIQNRRYVYSCQELYELMDKIQKDPQIDETLRALYGAMMTVIVQRHGHDTDQKVLN